MPGENPVLYSAAKGGVMSFSKSLALDVAPDIRVNILAPGFIETAFGQEADPELEAEGGRDDPARAAGAGPRTSPARRSTWPRMRPRS